MTYLSKTQSIPESPQESPLSSFFKDHGYFSLLPLPLLFSELSLVVFLENTLRPLLIFLAFSSLLPLFMKKMGLIIFLTLLGLSSYFLYPVSSQRELFWLLGLYLSYGLTSCTLFLTSQESAHRSQLHSEAVERAYLLSKAELEVSNEAKEKEIETLKEEIKSLKEDAKQRRIEKEMQENVLSRLQHELEGFLEAREELLQSVLMEKEEINRRLLSLDEREKKIESSSQSTPETTQEVALPCAEEGIGREEAILTGLYKQLRSQFEEKAHVLTQTRKELFSIEGKLIALEKEKALATSDMAIDESLLSELKFLLSENSRLEEEITALEGLISHTLLR